MICPHCAAEAARQTTALAVALPALIAGAWALAAAARAWWNR